MFIPKTGSAVRSARFIAFAACMIAYDAAACAVNSDFFNQNEANTLIACLNESNSDDFLAGRDDNLSTVLHLAIASDADLSVLDAIRRAAGDEWPDLRGRVNKDGRTALHQTVPACEGERRSTNG
jgi:hypothetical protein